MKFGRDGKILAAIAAGIVVLIVVLHFLSPVACRGKTGFCVITGKLSLPGTAPAPSKPKP